MGVPRPRLASLQPAFEGPAGIQKVTEVCVYTTSYSGKWKRTCRSNLGSHVFRVLFLEDDLDHSLDGVFPV